MLNDQAQKIKGLGVEGILGLTALTILLVGAVGWSARGPRADKTDFAFSYMGATILHDGNAARLYDRNFQVQTRESLFPDPNPLLYEHPPFEALLLSPLARLNFRTAYGIWGLLNVAAWVLIIVAFRPYCPWPKQDLAYVCLWPLFAPLGIALFQGQTSILVLGFISCGLLLLKKAKELPAGLCIGLALFKPQVVLPLMLVFLLRKRWTLIAGCLVTVVFLTALSVWAVGFRGLGQYAAFLQDVSQTPRDLSSGSAVDMGSLHGFVFALLGGIIHQTSITVISVVLSLGLLGIVAKLWTDRKVLDLGFAAALSASLAAGDHIFAHDLSPLILALFLVASHFLGTRTLDRPKPAMPRSLKYLLVLFWFFPVYFVLVAGHCLFLLAPFLVLFAILTFAVVRNPQHAMPPAPAVAST